MERPVSRGPRRRRAALGRDRAPVVLVRSLPAAAWLFYCSDCPGVPLYDEHDERWYVRVVVNGERLVLCVRCWRDRGRPWEPWPAEPGEQEQHEAEIRKRMIARRGADLHMVRSGKT